MPTLKIEQPTHLQIRDAFGPAAGNTSTERLRADLARSCMARHLGYGISWTTEIALKQLKLLGKTGKVTKRGIYFLREEFRNIID